MTYVLTKKMPVGFTIVLGVDTGAHDAAAVGVLHPLPCEPLLMTASLLEYHLIGRWAWSTADLKRRSELTGRIIDARATVKTGALAPCLSAVAACRERLGEFASADHPVTNVFVRAEHAWVKPKEQGGASGQGAYGPMASAGAWLTLASPAHAYELPNAGDWRKHYGFQGRRAGLKAQAMQWGRGLLGEDATEHECEALAMALIPPSLAHQGER